MGSRRRRMRSLIKSTNLNCFFEEGFHEQYALMQSSSFYSFPSLLVFVLLSKCKGNEETQRYSYAHVCYFIHPSTQNIKPDRKLNNCWNIFINLVQPITDICIFRVRYVVRESTKINKITPVHIPDITITICRWKLING